MHWRHFSSLFRFIELSDVHIGGLPAEIVKRVYAGDDRGKRRGDLRIARVRPMLLTLDYVAVNCGMKGLLYLSCVAGKVDDCAGGGYLHYLKSMRSEPRCDDLNVLVGRAELLAELDGREPLVKIGRGFIQLLGHQLI